ncbi:hypothetical protein [Pseudobythopirellula maris]|nr:hypothetical protein [Pseudobythopirellula maris]
MSTAAHLPSRLYAARMVVKLPHAYTEASEPLGGLHGDALGVF